MARKRDYKAEYARRVARAKEKGTTVQAERLARFEKKYGRQTGKAAARGHKKVASRLDLADDRVAFARSLEAQGYSKTHAAKAAHISTERYSALHRRGFVRQRSFFIPVIETDSEGNTVRLVREVHVDNKTAKHLSGFLRAWQEVKNSGGDMAALEPYDRDVIMDLEGVPHTLDTTYEQEVIDDYKYATSYS